jgi:MFS family permease
MLSTSVWQVALVKIYDGFIFAGFDQVVFNYLLDVTPAGKRPQYIANYNFFAGLGIVFGTMAGAFLAQSVYRFELLLNPVVAPIRSGVGPWGEMIELTPKPFSVGEELTDVTVTLERAGFTREPDEDVWVRYESEILDGYQLYLREGNNLACNIKYYMFAKFDGESRLVSAKGTVHEHGCL